VQLASDRLSLMPHQEAMVHRCLAIENASDFKARESETPLNEREATYGVMCDPPGAGKTFVVLALILQEIQRKKSIMRRMGMDVENATSGNDQSILVVPFNIYTQWEESIRDCCGDEVRFKSFVNYQDISSLFFSTDVIKTNDILLTTSLYYSNIASTMSSMNLRVRRVVFDEIDSIASLLNVPIACDHIWFVSASFNKEDLGKFKEKINRRTLDEVTVKCDPAFVNDSITLPPPLFTNVKCFNRYIDHVLHGMLGKDDMTAVNARSFEAVRGKHVMKTANEEKELVRNIIEDRSTSVKKLEEQLTEFAQRKKNYGLSEEEEEREMAARIELTKTVQYLENMNARLVKYQICPDTMEYMGNDHEDSAASGVGSRSNKVSELFRIIDERSTEEPDVRIILFSDHSSIFSQMVEGLASRNIEAGELDGGNVKAMDATLQRYKNGTLQVLMVNSSMYGCGMNLENTTDIVFLHALPESRKEQVIGRAQRYGRLGKLNVWNMYHENEMKS